MNSTPVYLMIFGIVGLLGWSLVVEEVVRPLRERWQSRRLPVPETAKANQRRYWLGVTAPVLDAQPAVTDALAVLADAEQRLTDYYP